MNSVPRKRYDSSAVGRAGEDETALQERFSNLASIYYISLSNINSEYIFNEFASTIGRAGKCH